MKTYQNRNSIAFASFISILASLFIFMFFYLGISIQFSKLKQQEKLNTTEKFIKYKSNLESIIYSKVILTKGYLAYLKTNPNISQNDTSKYLKNLIDPNDRLLRNLTILKDTTITFAYPFEGNSTIIGKNLADVPEQKESVLKVKSTLKPSFSGPINLLQGGTGFIARLPITLEDGTYWGQVSVVINGEELLKQSGLMETESDLNVSIFNNIDYPSRPFLGDVSIMDKQPLVFDMSLQDIDWKIAVVPESGWDNLSSSFYFWIATTFLISVFVGVIVFLLIYTKARLKNQAIYDALTKVYNRTYMYEYAIPNMPKNLKTNESVALLLIDLNDFKMINDVYGHKAGDEALKTTASRLSSVCKSSDAVIRLGGDEFLIILKTNDIMEIEKIQSEIHHLISKGFNYENKQLNLSLSVGYSIYPTDGTNIESLIQLADNKMYEEKRLFKNNKI